MATVVFSALGAAAGNAIGGTVLGLSMATVGRFAGAMIGQHIDNKLAGQGSIPSQEQGRLERIKMTSAGEGYPIPHLFGRNRVSGHVIWATEFKEDVDITGGTPGSKGMPAQPEIKSYRYSVSMALALCQGEISDVTRVWADGVEIAMQDIGIRVHKGTYSQAPDPKIEAVEGIENVPAYRGLAYVVLEDLQLAQFGNRVPQFSFEVIKKPKQLSHESYSLNEMVRGVVLGAGDGEYAMATSPVSYNSGLGFVRSANVNSPQKQPDFIVTTNQLQSELPSAEHVTLQVAWFASDLRCSRCMISPKLIQNDVDGDQIPWQVSGFTRSNAALVSRRDGLPMFQGTPADQAVIEGILHLKQQGKKVTLCPTLLFDLDPNNNLMNPYTGNIGQPLNTTASKITLDIAPSRSGSSYGTDQAKTEINSFFGTTQVDDLDEITNAGPILGIGAELRYRRFILHYAKLCQAAGGVDTFLIGDRLSELTQIQSENTVYPAVNQLIDLAHDVKAILGPLTKVGYSADWTEYQGHKPVNTDNDFIFNLDPLWADDAIDFIGIANFVPISDWRDGVAHLDAAYNSPYNIDYLQSNVMGGEYYDWLYVSQNDREYQKRTFLSNDDPFGEDWMDRPKDFLNWWKHPHFNRIGGHRSSVSTNWQAQSKPIRFTHLGCRAIDKGANGYSLTDDGGDATLHNPYSSNGLRDDYIQMRYIQAQLAYWEKDENNPISQIYEQPMIDLRHSCVGVWDMRPYPWYPNNDEKWSDVSLYETGYNLNGRAGGATLSHVVSEICDQVDLKEYDTTALNGIVRGYSATQFSNARAMIQPLSSRYAFDAVERNGKLHFIHRGGADVVEISNNEFVDSPEVEGGLEYRRSAAPDLVGRVQLSFEQAGGEYLAISEEIALPQNDTQTVTRNELPLVMTRAEARQTIERWLTEARLAQETVRFALPLNGKNISVGMTVRLDDGQFYRVDRIEKGVFRIFECTRTDTTMLQPSYPVIDKFKMPQFVAPLPVYPLIMDLPLISGDEVAHAPHCAVTATPWAGNAAVYDALGDQDFSQVKQISHPAVVGVLETELVQSASQYICGSKCVVKLGSGRLRSIGKEDLFNGSNTALLGDGSPHNWEVIQFQNASLIETGKYELSGILRGKFGSDATSPNIWAKGTIFVLYNDALEQLPNSIGHLGLTKKYKIGPAGRPFNDPSYTELCVRSDGIGLRPLAPCHMQIYDVFSTLVFVWVRRSRIIADSWDVDEIPLGEENEKYRVSLVHNGQTIRSLITNTTNWRYTTAMQAEDGFDKNSGEYSIEVRQISSIVGDGAALRYVVR